MNVTRSSWSPFPQSASHKLVPVWAWRRKIEMDRNKSISPWAETFHCAKYYFLATELWQTELGPLSGTKSVLQTLAFSEPPHSNAFSWQVPELACLSCHNRETCISELLFMVSSLLIRKKLCCILKCHLANFEKAFICDNSNMFFNTHSRDYRKWNVNFIFHLVLG